MDNKLLNDNEVENVVGGERTHPIYVVGEPIDLIGPYYLQSDSDFGGSQTREIGRQGLMIGKVFRDDRFAPYEIINSDGRVGWAPLSSIQLINP